MDSFKDRMDQSFLLFFRKKYLKRSNCLFATIMKGALFAHVKVTKT